MQTLKTNLETVLTLLANLVAFVAVDLAGQRHAEAVHQHLDNLCGDLSRWMFPGRMILACDRLEAFTDHARAVEVSPIPMVTEIWDSVSETCYSIVATPWIDTVVEAVETGIAETLYRKVGRKYIPATDHTCDEVIYRKIGRRYRAIGLEPIY